MVARNRALAAALALTCMLTACTLATPEKTTSQTGSNDAADGTAQIDSPSNGTSESSQPTESEPEPIKDATLTVASAGDVLPHMPVVRSAKTSYGYDFAPQFAPIKPWIEGADLALCSLEIPIVADGEQPSGYPIFGSPRELAKNLKEVGYDGCATATNHSLDRGFAGIKSTISALSEQGLGFAGTASTAEQAQQIQMYELTADNGIPVKIAHIAATTVTNGFHVPSDAPYSWNVVGELGSPVSTLIEQAKRARALGADIVIAHLHWGNEYQLKPNASQVQIATELATSGQVDLVFAGHPHVVQPIEKLPGGPANAGMWVAYSMGNQLSNQYEGTVSAASAIGYLATAQIQVPGTGTPHVSSLNYTLTTVDVANKHTVVPATAATTDPSLLHGTSVDTVKRRIATIASVTEQMGDEMLSAPTPTHTKLTLSREG